MTDSGIVIHHSQQDTPIGLLVALEYLKSYPKASNVKVVAEKGKENVELTSNGEIVKGENAALRYVARLVPEAGLYGASDATSAVDKWLEYGVTHLASAQAPLDNVGQEINSFLELRTVLVGYKVTIADLFIWGLLKRNSNWSSFIGAKGKTLVHLNRWFVFLSALPEFNAVVSTSAPQGGKKKESEKQTSLAGSQGNFESLDLPGAKEGAVVTRFPPEPSGYLHVGHMKAALMNNYYATHYKGKLIVRFDDTNPTKEKVEFVDNILSDLKTLGIKPSKVTYTSDYFDVLFDYAEKLIKSGHAYVDDLDVETMRKNRWDGIPSANRTNSIERNLELWNEMRQATEIGTKCVLRGKIDMSEPNKCLRDPTLYRCVDTPHHRTGSKYKLYPIYDFACPIVDSIEGVTHALRSSEYHDRNPLYNWVLEVTGLRKPFIQDFSRLNFSYTLLSKRKLQMFVDNGYVDGWNDPRFPTIQGILRRGMTVDALKEFILSQGASKSLTLMDMEKVWAINKKIIDPIVPRYTAIAKAGAATFFIKDGPATPVGKSVPRHKKNPTLGNKVVTYTNKIYLEGEDAKLIKAGEEVTLMDWGNAIVDSISTLLDGSLELQGHLHLEGSVKSTEKKLTWLPVTDDLVPVTLVEYDYLITKKKLEEGDKFEDFINLNSKFETPAYGDPNLRNLNKGDRLQLERRGYFITDAPYFNSSMVLNLIPDGHTSKQQSTLSTKVSHPSAAKKDVQPKK